MMTTEKGAQLREKRNARRSYVGTGTIAWEDGTRVGKAERHRRGHVGAGTIAWEDGVDPR
jgi:hypothetical protein